MRSILSVFHNHVFIYLSIFSIFINTSCSEPEENSLGTYESVTYKIDLEHNTKGLSPSQYTIDSVCSLSVPDSMGIFEISKFIVKEGRIYAMDSEITRRLLVFDTNGNYLFRLGDRGRAQFEYVGGPKDFFVDELDEIHVFDPIGLKIVVFRKDGTIDRIVRVNHTYPYSIGVLTYKRNLYCLYNTKVNADKPNIALLARDHSGENRQELLYMDHDDYFSSSVQNFFKNGDRLSHIPIMSDSVLVFNKDSLEKVVRFDFGGKFLLKEHPELVTIQGRQNEISQYNGVWELSKYQETDSLILLEYTYNRKSMFWLYNKQTKQIFNSNQMLNGLCPFYDFYLRDNQIISIVQKEMVDFYKKKLDDEEFKKQLAKAPSQIRDIIEGKIPTPAIFFITIK